MTFWNALLADTPLTLADDATVVASDAARDVAHARDGAVMTPLTHLQGISVIGEDAAPFLHNLLSNDVKHLSADAAQWTSFNSPKGRMLASMLLWPVDGGYRLTLAADVHAAMLRKLSMFVLRSKVKLTDAGATRAMLGVSSSTLSSCLAGAGLPTPAAAMAVKSSEDICVVQIDTKRAIVDAPVEAMAAIWTALAAQGLVPAGTAAWRWLDVQAGIPMITERTQDAFVAQMLNYELIGGVNFKKGCYPGQEIVARTQYLGKLKKRMYRVLAPAESAPAVGDELYSPAFEDQSVGKLVTVAPSPDGGFEALAVMQMQAADSGDIHLGAPDGAALRLATLPYPLDAPAAP